MAWSDLRGAELQIAVSEAESGAFGFGVGRINVPLGYEEDLSQITRGIERLDADLVVLRIPSHMGHLAPQLTLHLSDRRLLHVDTLVYWSLGVAADRVITGNARVVTNPDPSSVAEAIGNIFRGYQNHYASNPLLEGVSVEDAYRNWARHHVLAHEPVRAVVVDGQLAGVATYSIRGDHAEILLAGIVDGFRGQGLYSQLLRAVELHVLDEGVASLNISTQVHNQGVQRAWARYGFTPLASFQTYHVMGSVAQGVESSPAR